MVSLAEEIKLLSLPAPNKINVDQFENDPTNARTISKDDIYKGETENRALRRSNLRNKVVILLGEEDQKYAGETISRRELLKLRGDENLSQDDELSAYNSENGKQQDLEDMLKENYEINEYQNEDSEYEDSEYEDSEYEENEDKQMEDFTIKEQEGLKAQNERKQETSSDENEIRENYEMEESQMKEHKKERNEYDSSKEGIQKFFHSSTDEIQKGKAVVHQIALWDSVLENRIRLQKLLVEINKLPQHDVFDEVKEKGGSQCKDPLNYTQQLLTDLVHNFLILQQTLYKKNSDTARILTKESKTCESDEEIPSGDEDGDDGGGDEDDVNGEKKDNDVDVDESLYLPRKRKKSMGLSEYCEHITKRHAAFEHFKDTTTKKWSEKTRLTAGKVKSKSFNSFDRSTLNQIKQILCDKERLIKRTQLKRSSYRILGKSEVTGNKSMEQCNVHLKDYDAEIFDDDDFYHQLLREFIERKSNVDWTDPIAMGRQWLEIQRLRNKVKRKVDTKASKGRRLRYDVHPELVSFMAPQNRGKIADSSRNELFASLFGKRQPEETADINLFQ